MSKTENITYIRPLVSFDATPRRQTETVRSELLAICGALGLVGAFFPVITTLIATLLTDHDMVADTISDMGRGPLKWIMDTGFYVNAVGLAGLAVGAAHAHLGKERWSMGIFCLLALALVTALLGLWDKFGGPGDMSAHTRLTYLLGPLYLAGPLLMAEGVRRISENMVRMFVLSSVLWIVLAVAFKLAPDSFDGILEKGAVLATMLWTVPLSWLFFMHTRVSA
ncbi:DUF998 domain-containing protein [Dinoroseobacter sp. S375]|uniref:DUF998 domain-containing protein n=1 Tax=Dinoroseobacter sp. S375 TaxID=3415136 RepID=UPI003C7A5E38